MPPQRTRPTAILAVLSIAGLSFALLQSLVIPVLPTLQTDLHTTAGSVTWLVTGYLLSAAVATPILGRLGDVHGKERMLVICLAVLAVGTVICALAPTLAVMIVGRMVQGIGGAVFPLAFGIIRDELPPEKVPGAIGIVSSLLAVGGGLGIVLSGPIVTHLSYHWLFWTPLPFVVASAVAAHLLIPETDVRSPARPGLLGAVLLAAWLVTLLVGVTEGPKLGWSDPRTLGLIGGGLVLIVVWLAVESRSAHPLVDVAMLRLPAVLRTNVAALLVGVVMYSSYAVIPQLLQAPRSTGYGFGATVTASGLFLLPSTIANFVAGQLTGRLTRRFGSRLLTVAGCAMLAAATLMLALAHGGRWEIYLACTLLGLGSGLSFASLSNLVVEAVPPTQTGVAAGMNTNFRTIGGAIGGQVAITIISSAAVVQGRPAESGFVNAFLALSVAAVFGVLAALAVPTRRRVDALLLASRERELQAA